MNLKPLSSLESKPFDINCALICSPHVLCFAAKLSGSFLHDLIINFSHNCFLYMNSLGWASSTKHILLWVPLQIVASFVNPEGFFFPVAKKQWSEKESSRRMFHFFHVQIAEQWPLMSFRWYVLVFIWICYYCCSIILPEVRRLGINLVPLRWHAELVCRWNFLIIIHCCWVIASEDEVFV